ncbi:hypothetical protein VPH49_26070 [Pseudomonas luteola]|uniref:hypothetical protein n=1 Tax=Pseudomonas luteola TaxID=47886 RepID=UPI003A8AFC60
MKRYSLFFDVGGMSTYRADGSEYWGQFPARDKADAAKQAERIAKHHELPGRLRVAYTGKWSEDVNPDNYL